MPICDGEHTFIPRSVLDRGLTEEELQYAPKFTVTAWSNQQVAAVRRRMHTSAAKDGAVTQKDLKQNLVECIKENVVSWENCFDLASKKEIAFDIDKLITFPESILSDIMDELSDMSGMTIRQQKVLKEYTSIKETM